MRDFTLDPQVMPVRKADTHLFLIDPGGKLAVSGSGEGQRHPLVELDAAKSGAKLLESSFVLWLQHASRVSV